ncbi:MAG: hypothetical protein ACE5IZ_04945, partial [Dehalococcoidia bacterium]
VAFERVRTKDGHTFAVKRLTDPAEIFPYLGRNRAYCAYALCQLEPHRFPYTRWYLAQGDTGEVLVMHATGSLRGAFLGFGADLFSMGDPAALHAILCLHPGPRFVRVWAQVEHVSVLKRHFYLFRGDTPVVLRCRTAATFRPIGGPARRLTGADIDEINRLFRAAGSIGLYRRRFIDSGVWHGVFEDGRLVSVEGTQALSPTYGVAVVGPTLTHPKFRGRGYAMMTQSASSREVLEKCSLVMATVDPANTPALAVNNAAGDGLHTTGFRRDVVGLASLLRRLLAHRRAPARKEDAV